MAIKRLKQKKLFISSKSIRQQNLAKEINKLCFNCSNILWSFETIFEPGYNVEVTGEWEITEYTMWHPELKNCP